MNQNTNPRKFILGGIALLIVLILGGLVWAIMAGPDPDTGESNLSFNDVGDPTKGPADAPVTVHIFGDLQCPACRQAESGLRHAMETYKDKVRFVWNDFPLTSVHPNARAAATAARCAEAQGKFWEYHDNLYDQQSDWDSLAAPKDRFVSYAKNLGLDETSFAGCFDADTFAQKIQDDMAEGNSDTVRATPTFFIGNSRFEGSLTNAQWDQQITAKLPKS